MICFLIEILVHRTWFGQFDELYFVLNWLVMRCKLRPQLAADAQQTAWSQMWAKVKAVYFNHLSQGNSTNYYHSGSPRQGCTSHKSNKKIPPKWVENLTTPSSIFIFISSSTTGELYSQPIRGNVRQTGPMFPEHVEQSLFDPKYIFVTVQRILPIRFVKQKFAQLRPN